MYSGLYRAKIHSRAVSGKNRVGMVSILYDDDPSNWNGAGAYVDNPEETILPELWAVSKFERTR